MRRSILMVLCLATAMVVQAQDKVFLKNGSLIKGTIDIVDDAQVILGLGEANTRLKIATGDIRYIKLNERITGLDQSAVALVDSLNRVLSESRLYHQLRLGIISGNDDVSGSSFSNLSFDYTYFYKTRKQLHLGLGLGFDQYPVFEALPFSFELRKDLTNTPSPFYVYGKVGHALAQIRNDFIGAESQAKGGTLWAVGLGYQWTLGRSAILLSAGYRTQQLQSVWTAGDFRSVTEWNLNRLDFKVGFIF